MNRKAGIFFSYLLIGAEAFFSLVFTPFIIRELGDAEFGVYKLNETVSSYLLLLDLGVGQAIVRWIAKYKANMDKDGSSSFLGITTIFYLVISAVTLIGGRIIFLASARFFAVGLSVDEIALMRRLLRITIINAAFVLATVPYVNAIIGYEHFAFSKSISIIQIILRACCFYFALKGGLGSYGLVVCQLIITILTRLISVCYVLFVIDLKPAFHKYDKAVVKEIFGYSFMIFLLMISTQINNSLDNILLASFAHNAATLVAVYSVALQIAYYFNAIGDGMNGVLLPGVVRMVEAGVTNADLVEEMIRIGRLVLSFSLFVFVGFIVCGKRFICLWVGESYLQAYYIVSPLLFVYMVMVAQGIGDNILNAKKQLKQFTVLRVIVVFINIGVSLMLIKWNAIYGVMIGTLVSLLLGGVVAKNYVYCKLIDLNIGIYLKRMLRGIVPAASFAACLSLLINILFDYTLLNLLFMILITTCLYFIFMWLLGYSKEEKEYFRKTICKIVNRTG